jgi:hypothetical protein
MLLCTCKLSYFWVYKPNHRNQVMRLLNKHHSWTFSNIVFEMYLHLLIFHASPVLNSFVCFYCYNNTVTPLSDYRRGLD